MTEAILNTLFVVILLLCVYVGVRIFKDAQESAAKADHKASLSANSADIHSDVVARLIEQMLNEKLDLLVSKLALSEKLPAADIDAQLTQLLEARNAQEKSASAAANHPALEVNDVISSYSESSAFSDNDALRVSRSAPILTRIK